MLHPVIAMLVRKDILNMYPLRTKEKNKPRTCILHVYEKETFKIIHMSSVLASKAVLVDTGSLVHFAG